MLMIPTVCIVVCGLSQDMQAATPVAVVHGPDAPPIERLAARELAGQFNRLYKDVQTTVVDQVPGGRGALVLIGSPATNPHIGRALGQDWPQVSSQGLVLRSFKSQERPGLVVGGGSPAATLWAVYEWGHRRGIRYLMRGDVFPAKKMELELGGSQVAMEPRFKSRTWRTINDFAVGPESWGLDEHRRFLRQLAKLKYNRLMLSVYPWQPYVHYSFGGVDKRTATFWFDETYPLDGDTVGKKAFGGARLFENPDFAGLKTYAEVTAAGQRYVRGLIRAAHELGMTVGVSLSPLEFPREFQSALPGSKVAHQLKQLTITPGGRQGPFDKLLRDMVATKIRAYLKTYPELDTLYLTLPEFPEWNQHAERAWTHLTDRHELGDLTLAALVRSASERKLIASGKRGEESIRGNVVALAFLSNLFADKKLLSRTDGGAVELVLTSIDPGLFPVLDRVVPSGAATLNFVDYTARRVAENKHLLAQVPAAKVRSRLIMTLADDNVGILPQSSLQRIGELTSEMHRLGWDGFSTRYWVPAELDPSVYFLSRSAWDAKLTPRQAHDELWLAMTGNPAATERLWQGWQELERATELIDRNNIGFTFPVSGMLMKHYRPDPIPKWWAQASKHYETLMIELYRSQGSVDSRARKLLFYYAKRGEYVLEYLAAVRAVREAALAKKNGDLEKTVEHLEVALEQTYNCINTLSDVVQDQSDRGLIAVLNAYAYRPLLSEYEKMLDQLESAQ
jgi:hypothetical protein